MPLLLVMIGGAFGSALRYLAGRAGLALLGPALPWGTLFVNLAGGFLMGVLIGALARNGSGGNETLRLLLGVGALGGFTTFSSFSLETVNMIERGDFATALAYAGGSTVGAIGLLSMGLALVRALPA